MPTLVVDIDRTLTRFGLSGWGATGRALWRATRRVGLAPWLMRSARPREWLCGVVRSLHARGWLVLICTAREECYRELTAAWLRRYQIPFDGLRMVLPGQTVAGVKIMAARCAHVVIDDDPDNLRAIREALGPECPRLYDVTHQQVEILKLTTEALEETGWEPSETSSAV